LATLRKPNGLAAKGSKLWRDLTELHDFGPAELVILEESCRIADRLDKLDAALGDELGDWLVFRSNDDGTEVRVVVDGVLSEARQQANILKQLIAALRLPDEASGKRPQHRGGARGAYAPTAKGSSGKVSSLDRAREARGA